MPSGAPGFSRDHINVVLSDCGFGGMNIHITFFKRKSLKKCGSYLGGVVCVFNHAAFPFPTSSADRPDARPRHVTPRAHAQLILLLLLFSFLFAAINIVVKI